MRGITNRIVHFAENFICGALDFPRGIR